jgi:hypothetical protein
MASSLKSRIWSAAAANAGLQALLGTSPFRLFDMQLPQQPPPVFPSVTMFQVSKPQQFTVSGRLYSNVARMQFTIYGTGNDSENAWAVRTALLSFFDSLGGDGWGVVNVPGDRDAGIAQTAPLTYMRILDVMVFDDESY